LAVGCDNSEYHETTKFPGDTEASSQDDVGSDGRSDTGDRDTGGIDTDRVEPDTDTVEPDTGQPVRPTSANVVLPLGETLFLGGDDYLYFWGVDDTADVSLNSAPAGAEATIVGDGAGRLTPDMAGTWVVQRPGSTVTVEVVADGLNADTFLNFNYTPNQPLALDEEGQLWVASPPSNAVQRLAVGVGGAVADTLVPTGSWPTSVVAWPGTPYLLVSQTGRDTLGWLDTREGRLVDAVRVGDEPAGIVVDTDHPQGPYAYVALSGEHRVVRVDLEARRVDRVVEVSRDPRAVAFDRQGQRLYVASLLSSNATPQGILNSSPLPREEQPDIAVIDTASFELSGWVYEVATLVRGLHLRPDSPSQLIAGVGHSRNSVQGVSANSRPHVHGLAVIDLRDGMDAGAVRQIDLDERPGSAGPAPSPHTLATSPDGRFLVVSLSAGNALLVLNADTLDEVGRIEAGSDPRGLVFAEERIWTYAWLDNQVQSWPLSALNDPSRAVADSVDVGRDPTPPDIKEGQRLFNNASFSGQGDFSCNNCHIDGLTDGLVWNILLDGDVNTLPFRNIGGTGPFLWGGFLPTLFDFSREVLRLVGADADGEDIEKLTRYMQSVTAPPNPYTLPGGRFTASALRGKAIFDGYVEEGGAGCGTCHSGPLLTNRERVSGKTDGLSTDVPSLISVYDTGPWGRQGQWQTLDEMVDFGVTFTGAQLTATQLADLNAYVRQLPGDLLYLNAARPLDGTRNTFPFTPIELAFSTALSPGQEDAFALVRIIEGGGDQPVAGQFEVSGRFARFRLADESLPLESTFELRATGGLSGVLGQRTQEPIKVRFETGGVPLVDVTGTWNWDVSGLISGTIVIRFIQSRGGQVSGVILDGGGLIDLDHLEGFVSDTLLQVEPFFVLFGGGEILVEGVEATMVDSDGDGVADVGDGQILSAFGSLNVSMTRD
ncbi:MAG: hypothetical protein AAFX99_23790, partial [Myxococcota bacterium]